MAEGKPQIKRNRCVAYGCSYSTKSNISKHSFPWKSPSILRQWIKFVKTKRDKWSGPTRYSLLCSDHFTEECFPYKYKILESVGQKTVKKCLLPDAVPTIHTKIEPEPIPQKATSSKKLRMAYVKRQNQRLLSEKGIKIEVKMEKKSVSTHNVLDNKGDLEILPEKDLNIGCKMDIDSVSTNINNVGISKSAESVPSCEAIASYRSTDEHNYSTSCRSTDVLNYTTSCRSTDVHNYTTSCRSTDVHNYSTSCRSTDVHNYTTSCRSTDVHNYSKKCRSTDEYNNSTSCRSTDVHNYSKQCRSTDEHNNSTSCRSTDVHNYTTSCKSTDVHNYSKKCTSTDEHNNSTSCRSTDVHNYSKQCRSTDEHNNSTSCRSTDVHNYYTVCRYTDVHKSGKSVPKGIRGIRCVLCDSPVVKNIKLFPFPTQVGLRKAWLQFARQYIDEVNPRSSQICSQHFDEGSWTLVQKKIGEFGIGTSYVLNPNAVPSIIMLPSVHSTKQILESKNSLLSMIMAPKLEPLKNTPTKDFSKKALHASIESVGKIFDECTVCGSSKRGRIILHKLPDTIILKMKWLDFIEQVTKKRLQIPMARVRVCSQHFDDACYDEEQSVMNNTGYGVKIKKIMKKNAVPSIFWMDINGVQQVMIAKDEEAPVDEVPSGSFNTEIVKTEPDADEIEVQPPLPQNAETNSGLIKSTRSNLEHLLNKSVQQYIRPKSEKEMYNLLSKCEKEEIQKIKSIRGGGDEKPNLFACHCGEGFLSRALLFEHKKVHATSKDCIFKCSICQAKFHTHRTYDQHLITHFGLNRRLCAFCGQSLASRIDFNKHIQTVHGGKETPEKRLALWKEYGKNVYDGPEAMFSGNDFEIEIDYDIPEPLDTLLPLQSEASTSQSSSQSQNDCLGIIDKIADRLKDFKPSVCETQDHFSSESDDHDDERKKSAVPTKCSGKVKNKMRAKILSKTKRDTSNRLHEFQDTTKCKLDTRIKCNLDLFTDPRCFLSNTNTETCRDFLVIQIPKIDNVFSQLKESPTITVNSKNLHISQGPMKVDPECTKSNIPLYKKKKKRPIRFGGQRKRKRTQAPRDFKEEVFEYKVEPIPELHNLEHTKEVTLSLTEEGFADHISTFKSEYIEPEMDIDDVSGVDKEKVEDWKLMMNIDSDEEEPMVSEGVDENHPVNDVEENERVYGLLQNQPLVEDFVQDNGHSSSSSADNDTTDVANSSQGDTGIGLSSRSITEDEFNDQNNENTADSRPISPALGSHLSITNIITNIDSTSIKIEPFDSDHVNENVCGEDTFNDTKINFPFTKVKIKQEPDNKDVDESSSTDSCEEQTVFEKLSDQEPSVFFSQNDLDHKGRDSSIKEEPISSKSFQFQNVNLYDGEVDPRVVDDQTKTIVDDLLQKLNTKKEKEANITMEYFPNKPSGQTEYSCIECYEGFHHKLMLEEHQKYHNKEKPFLCRICSSQFQEYTTYTGHLTQHCGKNTKICFMCGFRTSTCRTLTNHFNAHHKKEEVESSKSSTPPPKTKHIVATVNESEKKRADPIDRFKCDLCYVICVDSEHLKRHLVSDCNVVKDALRRGAKR